MKLVIKQLHEEATIFRYMKLSPIHIKTAF
jgi:hypothetical protein